MKNSKTKKQSILVAILAFLLVGVLAVGMSSAWFQDKDTSDQATLVIGDKVDISSVTKLNTFTASTVYLPGDKINEQALSITLVSTEGKTPTDAIVRVKLTVNSDSTTQKAALEEMIDVSGATNWFKKEGSEYYYYNTVVTPSQAGETIQFPWKAIVPTTWGDATSDYGAANTYANQSVTVQFDVEAVQAKNLVDGHPYFNDVQVSGTAVSAKA